MIDNMVQRKVPKRKNKFAFLRIIPFLMVLLAFGAIFFFQSRGIQEDSFFLVFMLVLIPILMGVSFLETKNWKNTWPLNRGLHYWRTNH